VSIVVVGAGAIGLLVSGRLAQTSSETVLLARPATAAAITEHGLRITQDGEPQVVEGLKVIVDVAAWCARLGQPDLAILCVKGYDTAGALPALEMLQPRAILTLQNGIGNEQILAERFGAARIISGAITSSVEVEAPGHVTVTKPGGIGLAAMDGRLDVGRWVDVFASADFRARKYADYQALKWSKALLNMLGNATAAILGMTVAEVYADARLIALERRAFLEALHVMDKRGIRPVNLPRYPAALLAAVMRRAPAALIGPLLRHKIAHGRGGKAPSLHLDLARGSRRSEGEFLYGAVVCAARESGLSAPVNCALWETLRGITTGAIAWDDFRRKPERLLAAISAR
jgi:2-dehydropantoate 2-reductase